MRRATVFRFLFVVIATAAVVLGSRLALAQEKGRIVNDAEDYILEAQHGEKWAAEDKELDAKLAELRKK